VRLGYYSLLALGSVIYLSSCSDLGFYWQAASGHLELLNRKQDINELLDSSETSSELKRKLKLVERVRSFAVSQMALPDNDGYTGYVDLEKSYVTMVVTAAPVLELKAHNWCYFFVGCQEYRGYFDEGDAWLFARKMNEKQFDVSVGPVKAYSTLGWLNKSWLPNYFSDPVLSTFLLLRDVELITVLIHEMAHQVVFVGNDTSFNESFAVFVEQEGIRQFLFYSSNSEFFDGDEKHIYQWYLSARKDRKLFRQLIKTTFEKMKTLYASELSDEEKLIRKEVLFEQLRDSYEREKKAFEVLSYDNWFDKKLNNTHLLGVQRYQSRVEQFERLFEKKGRNWVQFFEAVRVIAKVSDKERKQFLENLD